LESCSLGTVDFSDCPNLLDIRCANNHDVFDHPMLTNLVFGFQTGPKLRHLCIRDNPRLAQNVPLTNLFSLQELLFRNCNQHGILQPASTNLLNLWAGGNSFI
jgi:hypothetical protein